MKIQNIQNYNLIYRNHLKNEQQKEIIKTENRQYNPIYYLPFEGGYSLNLPQTVNRLDKLAEKHSSIYPQNMREWLGMFLEKAGNDKKTLITAHKEYFSSLTDCSSLAKIKEKFPEFEDVVSVYDIETQENRESFITKFLKGETEYFDNDEDLAVQLIKLYWGEGFSLTDLKKYSDGCDLYYTMKKLNIPLASRDYGHILKFSDPEYNERLTREMTEKHMAAMDRKAQEQDGEPVYIKRGHLTEEHKKRISEGLKKFYEENPDKMYEMSERQKNFFRENPDNTHTFERVVRKAWSLHGAERIKSALSNFLKLSPEDMLDPIKLTSQQSALMKDFWAQNPWAQKLFSKFMKYSWDKVKQENETFYTIIPVPSLLTEYVEEKAGLPKGTLNLSTKFNPYTKESYYDKEAEAVFNKYASFPGLSDIMADTYQIAVLNIVGNLQKISKTKSNRPYTELLDLAKKIVAKNVLVAKGGYAAQSTQEARNDFLILAEQAARSECEGVNEIVDNALNEAFELSVHAHSLARLFH